MKKYALKIIFYLLMFEVVGIPLLGFSVSRGIILNGFFELIVDILPFSIVLLYLSFTLSDLNANPKFARALFSFSPRKSREYYQELAEQLPEKQNQLSRSSFFIGLSLLALGISLVLKVAYFSDYFQVPHTPEPHDQDGTVGAAFLAIVVGIFSCIVGFWQRRKSYVLFFQRYHHKFAYFLIFLGALVLISFVFWALTLIS